MAANSFRDRWRRFGTLFLIGIVITGSTGPVRAQDAAVEMAVAGNSALSSTAAGSQGASVSANTRAAYQYIQQAIRQGRPITLDAIQELNRILRAGQTTGRGQELPGRFRTTGVGMTNGGRLGTFSYLNNQGASPQQLGLLSQFLERISSRDLTRSVAVNAAADVDHFIVRNHLFGDGNGRTARAVADWIMMRNGLPPANHAGVTGVKYSLDPGRPPEVTRAEARRYYQAANQAAETQIAATGRGNGTGTGGGTGAGGNGTGTNAGGNGTGTNAGGNGTGTAASRGGNGTGAAGGNGTGAPAGGRTGGAQAPGGSPAGPVTVAESGAPAGTGAPRVGGAPSPGAATGTGGAGATAGGVPEVARGVTPRGATSAGPTGTGSVPTGTAGSTAAAAGESAGPTLLGLRAQSTFLRPAGVAVLAGGLHLGGKALETAFSEEGFTASGFARNAFSLHSGLQFAGNVAGFIVAERLAANVLASAIPGGFLARPFVNLAVRSAFGIAGAQVTSKAANGELGTLNSTDLVGSSVASGVGMAIGQTLIPIPGVGAIVGGVVGGLAWDLGSRWVRSRNKPPPGAP